MAKRAEFLKCGDTIKLIPMTAIQMLDIGISNSSLSQAKRGKPFYHAVSGESGGETDDNDIDISIIKYNKETQTWYDTSSQDSLEDNKVNDIKAENNIQIKEIHDAFSGFWLPLPYFKRKIPEKFEFDEDKIGPTNWVRGRLTKPGDNERDNSDYHLVLAVDTRIGTRPENLEAHSQRSHYIMPVDIDIETGGPKDANTFSLCGEKQLLDYIKEDWVQEWIDNCFSLYIQHNPSKARGKNKSELQIRGRMLYLALIQYLCTRIGEDGSENTGIAPDICFVQTGNIRTTDSDSIKIDLVLDIGHSRTCGFLLENMDNVDSNEFKGDSLELRDISQPDMIDDQVFESCLEFAIADFGDERLSRRTGRRSPPAFFWPSICRVGSEARRMSCQPGSSFGETGFINPKRYLWDKEKPSLYDWSFSSPNANDHIKINPVHTDPYFCKVLDDLGNYNLGGSFKAKYPRSAMTLFFLSEIINQAISQINSVSYRLKKGRSDTPRVLHNIMLTVPSAFSAEEINILKKRAKDAVKIIWYLLDWSDESNSKLTQYIHAEPKVLVQWDEATCTQATYLYAEIAHKFHADKKAFFQLLGKFRSLPDNQATNKEEANSIRIASLDIGGGSTDLSITTFSQLSEGGPIEAQFNFREGFDLAGNEVLKAVIEKVVLPGLICCLEKKTSLKDVENPMRALFQAGKAEETEDDRRGRNAFGKQICQVIALHALKLHEDDPDINKEELQICRLSEILKDEKSPSASALNYLNSISGETDLLKWDIPLDMQALTGAVEGALQSTMSQLCEVIFQYQADVLLVSGGLSRFPVVQKLLSNQMPVDINRIEFMHGYRVGNWYPYRDAEDVINEPKTTVVIGAAILNMARWGLINFSLKVEGFRFGTMIRHIGFMDNKNTIDKILFGSDSDEKSALFKDSQEFTATISEGKLIGFKQFPLKRWPVSPFYYIGFEDKGIAKKFSKGVRVTLSLEPAEDSESNSCPGRRDEYTYWLYNSK